MSLERLFYVSRAAVPYDTGTIRPILEQSQRNNRREDVTGCLLFSGCHFAQVLEGHRQAIEATLQRITRDTRHTGWRILTRKAIQTREYHDWSMGYLHKLDLEDALESLLLNEQDDSSAIAAVMSQMHPDTVRGALS